MKFLFISAFAFASLWVSLPVNAQVNYSLVCVDSVWYEPGNPQFINVRIYNGDTLFMNYPSVQIVSPANDTIGNPSNFVNFFGQGSNSYQTYTDTITQTGITDFSSYTFLIHEGFGSTTAVINWCVPLSVKEPEEDVVKIFPNPAEEKLYVTSYSLYDFGSVEIYDALGHLVMLQRLNANNQKLTTIDISDFNSGIYFVYITTGKKNFSTKFVKQ